MLSALGCVFLLIASEDHMRVITRIAEGHEPSARLVQVASTLPEGPTKSLLHSFRICTKCRQFKRWGEGHDGGYLTCQDGLEHGKIKAAYSMGVEGHDKWSDDVYEALKVPVNQFDCTVDHPAQKCPDCHFFKACLSAPGGAGGISGKTNWDLEEALKQTGQGNATDRSLLMKMDIEGAEWFVYSANSGAPLKKFKEIIVEFHSIHHESSHPRYLKAMQTILAAGFKVAHVHGNNYAGTYQIGGYKIPDVVEITFVADTPALATCENPKHNVLDTVNNPNSIEIPDSVLP